MDDEKNLMLRVLRNRLGYGPGWTFKRALWDYLAPKLILVAMLLFLFWFNSHIKVIWIP